MRWRFGRRVPDRLPETVAEEAQRFLSGRYLEFAFLNGQDVPPWAWISVIAHGDDDALKRASTWIKDHERMRPEYDEWGRLLEHVSRQIVNTANRIKRPVTEVQRDLLIPLELAVFVTPVGPATIYRLVTTMLDAVQSGAKADHRI